MNRLTQLSAAVFAAFFLTGMAHAKERADSDFFRMPVVAKQQSPAKGNSATPKAEKTAKPAKSRKSGKVTAKAKATSNRKKYGSLVSRYAISNNVPLQLAHAIIVIESNYRPNAIGSAGEIGLMQIKPATARMMGFKGTAKQLFDPETNIKYGMKYLGKARKLGGRTTCGTILRYNAGHGAKRMNPVSAAYCVKVKRKMAAL